MIIIKSRYEIVHENDFFIGKCGDTAKTSPLLQCAGVFIYSKANQAGILVHWQDNELKERLKKQLSGLELINPEAVIAGCGMPIECLLIEESRTYKEVRDFLGEERIKVIDEKIGFDRKVELKADFSNGLYKLRYLK